MIKKNILILAGPSAVGKSTVADLLIAGGRFALVRSFTTRECRGDAHDDEYFYTSDEDFAARLSRGEFVEHSTIAGCRYGTPRAEILRIREEGKLPLLILDAHGVRAFRESEYARETYAVYLYGDLNVMEERLYARELATSPSVEALLRFTRRKEGNIGEYLAMGERVALFDCLLPCEDAVASVAQITSSMETGFSQSEEEKEHLARNFAAAAEEKKNYLANR